MNTRSHKGDIRKEKTQQYYRFRLGSFLDLEMRFVKKIGSHLYLVYAAGKLTD